MRVVADLRNIFNHGAIWLQTLICNRLNPWFEMQAVWVSIQWNHPFANERLLLWRLMHRGCHHSSDVSPLASSDTSHMQCRHNSQSHKGTYPEWLWMTPTTYGRDFAYCLKSHGGVRGVYMSLWWHSMHCAPFLLTMQILFASVSFRRVVADLRLNFCAMLKISNSIQHLC